ncbi:lipopolysaccharide assembly protein LapB [Psychrobium sp. 1_MG-2023]|uniref:tetratricopeptide repeat protein n=1 Tax=Psychrobium sp. 1_MG-2023 TaxID=3062624 RepID=UPI000C34CA7F|nr:hypothetical protein [Psychrobium sp. 1_MG-2023]MDP2562935.1 hypothetical protein [Psychrobium sp. 1_MG-2023]PKF54703.1 hypothetical protein CW748_15720 [Alteromonadales bacterium alter-6D02]
MKKTITALCISLAISTASFASTFTATSDVTQALENGNVEVAAQHFSTLPKAQQTNLEGAILQARIWLGERKAEQAYDSLEELLEKHPDHDELHYRFGLASVAMAQQASIFSKLGYAKEGRKAWERVVKRNPQHIEALEALIGFYRIAPGIAGGDVDEALVLAKKLKSIDAEKGFFHLATVYQKMENTELTEQTLAEGIEQFPQSHQLYFFRGLTQVEAQDWGLARTYFSAAVKHGQKDTEKQQALYQLGKVAAESGEHLTMGIESLLQLTEIDAPMYKQWVPFRLAQLYVMDGQISKANALLKQVDTSNDERLKDEVKALKKEIKKVAS